MAAMPRVSSHEIPETAGPHAANKTLVFPWKSKTKQRMVFGMIHVKDFPLLMGKVWSLDFLGFGQIKTHGEVPFCWGTIFSRSRKKINREILGFHRPVGCLSGPPIEG